MNCFVGYDDPYYQRVIMGMLAAFHVSVKPRKNPNFRKKSKMVFSIKIQNKYLISDDETGFTVKIVSRNLSTTSNFVEFRDSQNFTFFEAPRVTRDMWQVLSGSH